MVPTTADISETMLDVVVVDATAELCSNMDLGTPGVVREHFHVAPPSLLSSLSSFTRRIVVQVSPVGVVVVGGGGVT